MQESRPHSPAAERNRGPILEVLLRLLPVEADVLEVGAGTGQHAEYFSQEVPDWTWWPTNAPGEIDTLRAGLGAIERANLRRPDPLDVRAAWPARRFDAVYSANTAHIMQVDAVQALFRGAAGVLAPTGRLVLYGPFSRDGRPTSASNARFDADLRARDPGMGVRDLDEMERWADEAGFVRVADIEMPANNLVLAFELAGDSEVKHDGP